MLRFRPAARPARFFFGRGWVGDELIERPGRVHLDLAGVARPDPDPFGLNVRELRPEHVGPSGVAAEGAVDDRFAALEFGEGVGTDSELAYAAARAFPGACC